MYHVIALYKFTEFKDPDALRAPLRAVCVDHGIVGTILVASEGINGTIAAPSEAGAHALLAHIKLLPGCHDIEWKTSQASTQPFKRLKIRLKREIVTMGCAGVKPAEQVGTYVEPKDWNALIGSDDVVTIDTRNDYEIGVGTFEGALDPQITRFREFPAWWQANKARFAGKRIAMFCTGGIRCEKTTSFLRSQGVEDVFHLKGGILKYLEEIDQSDSKWQKECYVFDGRVSVGHGLQEGVYAMCHACGRPLAPEDLKQKEYEAGVQCHHCVEEYLPADRARFRERQRQLEAARGRKHAG